MIMFLTEDLHDMCGKLMHEFVKKSFLDSADTIYKVTSLDVLEKKNHKSATEFDVGFAAKATLANVVKTKQWVIEEILNSEWSV